MGVSAFSIGQVGRLALGALSFIVWGAACAEGTNAGDTNPDPLVEGTAGTNTSAGTSDGGNAGTSSAGDTAMPMAGKTSTGTAGTGGVATGGMGGAPAGGSATAGAGAAGKGGTGGTAGTSQGGTGGMAGMAGMAGAGGKGGAGGGGAGGGGAGGGSAGTGGGGGTGSTSYRYAKLVATSEQSGNVWSSVAELQILTTGSVAISRTGWAVTADSQELDDQMAPASAAIDGNNSTFWHTEWEPAPNNTNDAKLPHSLIVDMTAAHPVVGFSYLPRQDNQNGRIKGYEFYLSKDGATWGTAVKTGNFAAGTALQTITF